MKRCTAPTIASVLAAIGCSACGIDQTRSQWRTFAFLCVALALHAVTPPSLVSSPSEGTVIAQQVQAVPVKVSDAAPWSPRWWHASVVHDGRIWVLGGLGEEATSDVWYSTDGRSWTQATDSAPWAPRVLHAAVSYDGHMWILGGNAADDMNDVWRSVDGISWERVTNSAPWSARIFHSAVVFDGKMWVLGGARNWNGPSSIPTDDVWFSSDGVERTLAADSTSWPPGLHSLVVHDERIWGLKAGDPSSSTEVWYTSDGTVWTQATAAPFGRSVTQLPMLSHAGRIWVLGDSGIWSSLDGIEWSRNVDPDTWAPPAFATSVVQDGRIWVMGGRGRGVQAEQLGATAVIDRTNGLAYFETSRRRVVKLALGEGSGAPTFVDAAPVGSGAEWPEAQSPGVFSMWRGRYQRPTLTGPNVSSPLTCAIDCQRRLVGEAFSQAASLTPALRGQIEQRDDGRVVLVSAGRELCAAASAAQLGQSCRENLTSTVVDWETRHLYYYSYLPPLDGS